MLRIITVLLTLSITTCFSTIEKKSFNGKNYYFNTEQTEFHLARNKCRIRGQDLARIDSEDENEFVNKHIAGNVWFGLKYFYEVQDAPDWFWESNKRLPLYLNWCPGEDNDYKWHYDCAVINHSRGGCWEKWNCYKKPTDGFVCQD